MTENAILPVERRIASHAPVEAHCWIDREVVLKALVARADVNMQGTCEPMYAILHHQLNHRRLKAVDSTNPMCGEFESAKAASSVMG